MGIILRYRAVKFSPIHSDRIGISLPLSKRSPAPLIGWWILRIRFELLLAKIR